MAATVLGGGEAGAASAGRRGIVLICAVAAMFDGFDLLAAGVAAPAMAKALHVPPGQVGPVLSAALLGLMLGAFGLGPAGDRYGRKWVLIAATVMFAVFSIATAAAATVEELVACRLLTGIGLGGATANFIALAADHTPAARRQAVAGLLWTGFPLGGVLAGVLGSWLIERAGWPSLFLIGGVAPLGLAAVMAGVLPRASRGTGGACPAGATPGQLFAGGRAAMSALLWIAFFVTFLLLVTDAAWTPTLLRAAGFGSTPASLAVAMFAGGSVIGTPLAGILLGYVAACRLLPALLLMGAAALGAAALGAAALGAASCGGLSAASVLALQALAGFAIGAASSGLIALAASVYPARIRATGVGWAMGAGRFGSFLGPLGVGLLLARGWHGGGIFALLGAASLGTALVATLLHDGTGALP